MIRKIYNNNVLTKALKYNHFDIRKQYLELNKSENRIEQIDNNGYPKLYRILQRCIIEKFYDMIYILINSLDLREKNIFIKQSKRNLIHPILQSIRRVPYSKDILLFNPQLTKKNDKDYLILLRIHLNMIYFLCKFYNCNDIYLITNIIYKSNSNNLDEGFKGEGYRYDDYVSDKIGLKNLSYNIRSNTLYYTNESGSNSESESESGSDSESESDSGSDSESESDSGSDN